MTSVGRGFAAQHGHGRILAGISKDPDDRGGGRIDFFPGTLLGLCTVFCNPEYYETACWKWQVGGRKGPQQRQGR